LAWLGARVVIAEVDRRKGREAAARVNEAFGAGTAVLVRTDVGDERSVDRLARRAVRESGWLTRARTRCSRRHRSGWPTRSMQSWRTRG
jgi:hypothetical protein